VRIRLEVGFCHAAPLVKARVRAGAFAGTSLARGVGMKMEPKRIAKALAGCALVLWGARRHSMFGLLVMGAGGIVVGKLLKEVWAARDQSTAGEVVAAETREPSTMTDADRPSDLDKVDEAGFESFPASDPPAH
jgi:hypothetical protein